MVTNTTTKSKLKTQPRKRRLTRRHWQLIRQMLIDAVDNAERFAILKAVLSAKQIRVPQ